jgi:hypothetical protein
MTTFEEEIYLKSLNTGNYVNIYQKRRRRCRGTDPAAADRRQAGCPNDYHPFDRGQSHSGTGGDYRREQIVQQNQFCHQRRGQQDGYAGYEGLQGLRQHVQEEEKDAGQCGRGNAAAWGDSSSARGNTAATRRDPTATGGNTTTARRYTAATWGDSTAARDTATTTAARVRAIKKLHKLKTAKY